MALEYGSSLVDIDSSLLEAVLKDNYRPHILENFVYDLFSIGLNYDDSPTATKYRRTQSCVNLNNLEDILDESYNAVVHRFTSLTIESLAADIQKSPHTEVLLKLLQCSMIPATKVQSVVNWTKIKLHFSRILFEQCILYLNIPATYFLATLSMKDMSLMRSLVNSLVNLTTSRCPHLSSS
jgi:hypothetical protein